MHTTKHEWAGQGVTGYDAIRQSARQVKVYVTTRPDKKRQTPAKTSPMKELHEDAGGGYALGRVETGLAARLYPCAPPQPRPVSANTPTV